MAGSLIEAGIAYESGVDFFDRGDYENAIKKFSLAIVLNSTMSDAYFSRGLCYYHLKEFEKSIADYTKAIELDPRNPLFYNNRGDAYYRMQKFELAIKDYDKAIALSPDYYKAYYNRGLAYACIQDYEHAVEDFGQVIEISPEFAEAYHLRGITYEYMNDYSSAVGDYKKALELDPNNTEIKRNLTQAMEKEAGGGAEGSSEGGKGGKEVNILKNIKMRFKDVAGMFKMKEQIQEAIVYPLKDPELARKYGKESGGGILLYGPPGCGKTFIVKAAAGECGATFINAKISDIVDMYVGNTEKNLHKIFDAARKNKPAIIFFDEIEALGGRRDKMEGGQQHLKMAVNQMLYELDGIEADNREVLVIGATNAPWDVDPALRRSGRFSHTIYIPEPDFISREGILKMHAKKIPKLGKHINYKRLALATVGYAAADLKAVVDEAAAIPWREAYHGKKERAVVEKDFIQAIRKRKSSLPPWYAQANTQIGTKKKVRKVDGKRIEEEEESNLGPEEKEAFSDLLNVIKRRNGFIDKIILKAIRELALVLPIPGFVIYPFLFLHNLIVNHKVGVEKV